MANRFVTWWKKPVKTRTNGTNVIIGVLEGVGNGLRAHKITELERRIAALEQGKPRQPPLTNEEIAVFVKSMFDKNRTGK